MGRRRCEQTLYRWKRLYGGLEAGEAKRPKTLEEESVRLERLVTDQALANQTLKELLRNRRLPALLQREGMGLRFLDPGKPDQNVTIESFNGRFRGESLNEH